jgi:hypothetical protein
LFAAERLVPTPVPDEKLTPADRSLRWHFDTVDELLQDKRMRRAITTFANNKAQMFDTIMDNPKIDDVATARYSAGVDPDLLAQFDRVEEAVAALGVVGGA